MGGPFANKTQNPPCILYRGLNSFNAFCLGRPDSVPGFALKRAEGTKCCALQRVKFSITPFASCKYLLIMMDVKCARDLLDEKRQKLVCNAVAGHVPRLTGRRA